MPELSAEFIISQPEFWQYCEFLESGVKPECADCASMQEKSCFLAEDILRRVVTLSHDESEIQTINEELEEKLLIAGQALMANTFGKCDGEELIDKDPEPLVSALQRVFGKNQAYWENKVMPFASKCGID